MISNWVEISEKSFLLAYDLVIARVPIKVRGQDLRQELCKKTWSKGQLTIISVPDDTLPLCHRQKNLEIVRWAIALPGAC
jgi:hypothetical protein